MSVPSGTLGSEIKIESGSDDLAMVDDRSARTATAYVVVGSGDDRGLIGYNLASGSQSTDRHLIEDADGTIALHAVANRIVLTESNVTTARVFDTKAGFVAGLRLPVQIAPSSVSAAAGKPRNVVVLNRLSNTLSVIDLELVLDGPFDLAPLVAYRRAAVEAFADLLGGFLQYLKDCICEHLLVKAPECPDPKDLDLAAVSIRANSVYKVCNWSRRKYVKSFPAVGYWLSLVPVLPMLREAIGRFCCSVLTEYTSRYETSKHDSANDNVPTDAILRLLEIAQEEDPMSRLRSGQQSLRSAGAMALRGDWAEANKRLGFGAAEPAAVALAGGEEGAPVVDVAALSARIDALEAELAELRSK
jgi:hypothetical protein